MALQSFLGAVKLPIYHLVVGNIGTIHLPYFCQEIKFEQ